MRPSAFSVFGSMTLRCRELAFDLEDAPFDEALLVLRSLVLGVLRQIALCARFRDRLDHRVALDALQAREFFLEFFGTANGQGNGGHDSEQTLKQK